MTTPAPDSHEAQQALNVIREQQANLVRSGLPRRPIWYWLAAAPLYVLVGLAFDLFRYSLWAFNLFGVVVVAAVIALERVQKRRSVRMSVRHVWLWRHFDNRTYWIFVVWIAVPVWALQFTGGAFRRMGLAWPYTLGGCVAAAAFLVTGPLAITVIRRRVIANVESGRGDQLHGLARLLSFLPVYEAHERYQERGSKPGRS